MDPCIIYKLHMICVDNDDNTGIRSMLISIIEEAKKYSSVVRQKLQIKEEPDPLGHAKFEDEIVVWGRSLWGIKVGIPELHSREYSRWPQYDTYCTCGNRPYASSPQSDISIASSSTPSSMVTTDSGFSEEQKNSAWLIPLWESWVFRSILIYENIVSILLKREMDIKPTYADAFRSVPGHSHSSSVERRKERPNLKNRQKEYLSTDKTERPKKVSSPRKADIWWDQYPSLEPDVNQKFIEFQTNIKVPRSTTSSVSELVTSEVEESEYDEWWQRMSPSPDNSEIQDSPSPTPPAPLQQLLSNSYFQQDTHRLKKQPPSFPSFPNRLHLPRGPRFPTFLPWISHHHHVSLYPTYPTFLTIPIAIPLFPPALPRIPSTDEFLEMALCLSDSELSDEFMAEFNRALPFYRKWYLAYNVHF